MGFASCKALVHTRPASVPGLNVGLPPLDQARMLAVSHTKPLHDAVAQMADDLYGGSAPAPHFYQRYRFFDRLKHPVLSGCLLLFMLYFTRLRVCEISLFDLCSASAPYQRAVAVIQSELFINRCDVIHIDDIAPVASEKA